VAAEVAVDDVGAEVRDRGDGVAAENDQQRVGPGQRQQQRGPEPNLEGADVMEQVLVVRREQRDASEEGGGVGQRPGADPDAEQPRHHDHDPDGRARGWC
jgi:hypothetical protein